MSIHEVSWTPSIHPNYENYEIRLKTFSDRFWPISYYQNESIMAKAGFFYSGLGDLVKCAYCGVCLHQWQPDDDPISEHKNSSKIVNLSVYYNKPGIKATIEIIIFQS